MVFENFLRQKGRMSEDRVLELVNFPCPFLFLPERVEGFPFRMIRIN